MSPTPTTSSPTPTPTAGNFCGAASSAAQGCRTLFNGVIVEGMCLPSEGCRCYFEGARCGNGVVEGDEECDDGGICIAGANAGTRCDSESQCQGNGVCVGGAKAESACADNTACPRGQCIHCRTFGGDGCAANCTNERDSTIDVVSGVLEGATVLPGTSGVVIHGDILTIPLPLDGTLTLTTGKLRVGQIPIVVKAGSMQFRFINVGTLGCACVRGIARKTCGGTLFDTDGSPSLDCTLGLTIGDSVCAGRSPCTSAYGEGNAMSGGIGCPGLDRVDYGITQDAGAAGKPGTLQVTFSGSGGSGAAAIFGTTAFGVVVGFCTGSTPDYGPDGELCTADDPPTSIGTPWTTLLTTGTATGEMFNANGVSGNTIGPFTVTGVPLDCAALMTGSSPGGTLVSAATVLGQPTTGDIVITSQFVLRPGNLDTPTPTPTPTPIPPLCIGDCNGDGQVTVDELITGVGMALGNVLPDTCPAFCDTECGPGPGLMLPTVACLMRGVNYALDGCPQNCATDQDCDPGNGCLSRHCTSNGCQYECICV